MPIIKSAKKRVRKTAKATVRNAKTKRNLRDALKSFSKAIKSSKKDQISAAKNKAFSSIDTAAKKNLIHKNKAARKKSALSRDAKKAGAKPVARIKKAAPKKTAVKKPVAKKSTAKKTVAKKTKK